MTIGEITSRYNTGAVPTGRRTAEGTEEYEIQDSFTADTEIRFDKGPQNLSKDQLSVLKSLGINAAQVSAGNTPSLVLGSDGRMSLQFAGSSGSTGAASSEGEGGSVSWKSIEKTLRQWADFNAVTDDQVSLVKGELKPVLENKGIEFDSFKIKSALNDPTGVSAVDAYGSVCFEFVNGETTSMRSFSIDSLREEWSAGQGS